jgi:aryl-alcohol dehydrogenase-like predicted oxidoreductase
MKTSDELEKQKKSGRRDFLKIGGLSRAADLAYTALPASVRAETTEQASASAANAIQEMMPTRNLSRTGFRVGIFGLGGLGALEKANNKAIALPVIEKSLELGVNYFDTSAFYGGSERWSERYLGQALKGRRNQVFMASKTKEGTRDAALKNLDVSLRLLNTDHLDTWQLHDVGTLDEVDHIFGQGGALEALRQARDQKMVWHLGLTGRLRPDALMESIRRFQFDTILMGLNAADKYYHSFAKDLLPLAVEKQMGILRYYSHDSRADSLQLDAASGRRTGKIVGGDRRNRHHAGHADQTRNHVLHPFPPYQHRHHWVRFGGAGRRVCSTSPRVHTTQ